MKRYKTIVITFMICIMFVFFCRQEVNAETGKYGKNITWRLKDGVLTISGKGDMPECGHKKLKLFEGQISCNEEDDEEEGKWYEEDTERIVIEEGVTSIAAHAFFGVGNIKSISIPSSVKKIGHAAFACSDIQEIEIPDSVTSIGEGAFFGCSDLERVTLPKNLKKIRKMTFDGCYSLKELNIPPKVQTIGEGACDGCGSLKELNIPPKVQTIGVKAFYSCDGLIKVNWAGKSTLKVIEADAFKDCNIAQFTIPVSVNKIISSGVSGTKEIKVDKKNKKYKSKNGVLFSKNGKELVCYPANRKKSIYKIPKGVKIIGTCAFVDNWQIKKVTMPDSVTVVEQSAFSGAEKLKTVRLSKNLKKIERSAFNCSLTALKLPSSLVVIEDYAFNCFNLKGNLVVPKNVKEIGYHAFTNAFKVKKILIKSKKLKKVDKEMVFSINKVTIILPKSKKESYKKFFTKKRQGKNIKFIYK